MKTLIATIFAAGVSLTTLSSAQAITTAAPLAEAAKKTSSVLEAQGCGRGSMMGSTGRCEPISWNYKKSKKKKKKSKK